jgi:hypothetical protein
LATTVIFKKLPKVNNCPRGEYSPNLAALSSTARMPMLAQKFPFSRKIRKTRKKQKKRNGIFMTLFLVMKTKFCWPGLPDGLFPNQKSKFG